MMARVEVQGAKKAKFIFVDEIWREMFRRQHSAHATKIKKKAKIIANLL